ncbi:MAG: hypothetical protein LBP87_10710 [Planctomycetaceae bacterium]|nr:hypothetical protein [Planctomycetaceae bacterium]
MITNSKGSQCFAEGLSPTIGRRTRRQGIGCNSRSTVATLRRRDRLPYDYKFKR